MKVLIITQWFHPEPVFKGLSLARALKDLGHSVDVVTGFPNYPEGRVYAGYSVRPYRREQLFGVRVHRVAIIAAHGRSSAGRFANYCSFAISALIAALALPRPDVIYVYDTPATAGLAAGCAGFLKGVPVVLDVQDLWPDNVAACGFRGGRLLARFLGIGCLLAYAAASKIVVLSPGFLRILSTRGVPAEKLHVIYNWSDESNLSRAQDPATTDSSALQVVYAGTFGGAQGLGTVIEAAQLAKDLPLKLTLIGAGIDLEPLRSKAEQLSLTNVTFLDRQSPERIASFLAAADGLLVHLKDADVFRSTIPSKTQAYMRVGKPIIMAVAGDAANLVRNAGCGIVCEPNDPAALASAFRRFAALSLEERIALGRSGAEYYERHLSREVGARRFEQLFLRLSGAV